MQVIELMLCITFSACRLKSVVWQFYDIRQLISLKFLWLKILNVFLLKNLFVLLTGFISLTCKCKHVRIVFHLRIGDVIFSVSFVYQTIYNVMIGDSDLFPHQLL